MKYYIEDDYMVGICNKGDKFIFDIDDYEKVSKYTWFVAKKQVCASITKDSMNLSRYLLGLNKDDGTVKYKNRNSLDVRRKNLFSGNTYVFHDDYIEGACFDDKVFKISIQDYDKISKYRWHVDTNGYVLAKIDGKSVKQHRLIMGLKNGEKQEIDHINRDCLDNRRENLRFATRSQNCINRDMTKRNPQNSKGIYLDKSGKWVAKINSNNKRKYLGCFNTKEEAIKVREEAEIELHKEFRCS